MRLNRSNPIAWLLASLAVLCLLAAPTVSSAQDLRGLQVVEEEFAFYDWEQKAVRNMMRPPTNDPVVLRLSKHVYPAEDGHLDAVVWLDPRRTRGELPGRIRLDLVDEAGKEIGSHSIDPIPGKQLFFSFDLPASLEGRQGGLRVTWENGGSAIGSAARSFDVAERATVERSGAVTIRVPNTDAVTAKGVPVTVGVPFPRGALPADAGVRLIDESGEAIALQTRVAARWSRFGPTKWLTCDFVVDLRGEAREFRLEYGPGVDVPSSEAGAFVADGDPFPAVTGERVRIDEDGLAAVLADGRVHRVLSSSALLGGYVEHEDGRRFEMAGRPTVVIEERGPVKTVIRATGDYVHRDSGETFCRFDTRYYFYRSSPAVRMMHTWVFTGDGNRDRIRDMGWRLDSAGDASGGGYLLGGGDDQSGWVEGDYLLQHAHDAWSLVRGAEEAEPGGWALGVMRIRVGGAEAVLGVKDFWQNYPSELSVDRGGMTFHNWPRHGRRSETRTTPENAFRLSFAHSGDVLDFRLPDEFLTGPIADQSSQKRSGERHWSANRESANAQGIARTEEMWLYVGGAGEAAAVAEPLMRAFNDETLRGVVDPEWLADSGAFYEIHPKDEANYAEDERIYEMVTLAPQRWTERIGLYGKWIYGDALYEPRLIERSAGLYRTFRKSHQGWPYSWVPYVRSGDSRLFKLADNATRQMIDANFCHYVSDEVRDSMPDGYYRRQGWWFRSMVPWTGWRGPVTRSYLADCDYLWHATYVTGYERPADIARLWGELAKEEPNLAPPYSRTGPIGKDNELRRMSFNMLKSCVEMYQATFDPWFMVAMHEIADMHLTENRDVTWHDTEGERVGHFWESGDREYHRFTGRPEYEPYFLNASKFWATYRTGPWSALNPPMIESTAYAHLLSGDDVFARRAAYFLDYAKTTIWTDESRPYLQGIITNDIAPTRTTVFVGYYLKEFPLALAMFERMGRRPEPLAEAFAQLGHLDEVEKADGERWRYRYPVIKIRKSAAQAVPLAFEIHGRKGDIAYEIVPPAGGTPIRGGGPAASVHQAVIPAASPAGDYTVRVESLVELPPDDVAFSLRSFPGLMIPLTPPGTPEVFVYDRDRGVGNAQQKSQYWFQAPDDLGRLGIDFRIDPPNRQTRRLSVWNPAGELAWDRQLVTAGQKQTQAVRAEIDVPPDQRGDLWRVTLPGRNTGFRLPDVVPNVLAVDRERWFLPEFPEGH